MARKRNYVNNPEFYAAMVEYKKAIKEAEEQGDPKPKLPDYIGECIYHIANRLSHKSNFIGYTYRDDMIGDGLENAIKCAANFDPDKSNNPFAYFTQVIYFAFLRRIEKEKKQMYVKHKVMENSVLTDTIMTRENGDTAGSAEYVDLDNDYMSDFVQNYEEKMQEKRAAARARAEEARDQSERDE